MQETHGLTNSPLSDCNHFIEKFKFQHTLFNDEYEEIENEVCSLRFGSGGSNGFQAIYTGKQALCQFELREIIEFYFDASDRKIFNTFFYKNLERNKVFPLITKMMLAFLEANKPEIFIDKNDWSADLRADLQLKKIQVDFVFKHFLAGHPIKKLLYEANPLWRSTLESYLRENKISLVRSPKASVIQQFQRWSRSVNPFNGKPADIA
ncbi:MAG: hypothetical protein V4725_05675 [Bacteroidota bacterium]